MAHKVTASIRLKTPPSLEKVFDISDDVTCVVCEAVCNIQIEFSCASSESLDDLSFKCKNNLLENWLYECQFVNKFSESCVFNGSQLTVTLDGKPSNGAKTTGNSQYTNWNVRTSKPMPAPKPTSLSPPPPLMPRVRSAGAIAEQNGVPTTRRKSYRIAVNKRASEPARYKSSPNLSPQGSPNESPVVMRRSAGRIATVQEEIYGDFIYQEVTARVRPRTNAELSLGAIGLGARKLWSEMPRVIAEGLCTKISDKEKKQQEALFEIISTEHTYLKGLDTLVTHFIASPELTYESILSKADQKVLFSNIQQVREVSKTLCVEMEKMWEASCLIKVESLCAILDNFIEEKSEVYITNTRNSVYQERKLAELKENPLFFDELRKLETSGGCQGLPMLSYLTLPMQRITRLPLLLDAITKYMDPEANKEDYHTTLRCQCRMQELVKLCNEGAREMAAIEEIADLDRKLQFKKVRKTPIVSKGRSIVKQGDLGNIGGSATTTIKLSKLLDLKKDVLHIILLNDLLLITKRKGDAFYVRDYGQRALVKIGPIDESKFRMTDRMFSVALTDRNTEYVLECDSVVEKERWVAVLAPEEQIMDDDKIYQEWDCPQVQAHARFVADEPDLLGLEVTDVVKVMRKCHEEGWYYGERIRDGEKGWFPHAFTTEIVSEHTRTQNMKKRHLLMVAAAKWQGTESISS